MPGKVKVKIVGGRNLPVMDRSSDTTDAYVEIKLGTTTYKTDVCRKSLHPQWNSEWYRFEVDDSELQDEPLQIRLMDHDTYSANDAIGKVYLDLNPLLLPAASLLKCNGDNTNKRERAPTPVMSGWIPVYDTMHGIRGEVNITVKVELFSDFNKFRQSSCGVQFFYSQAIPHGYYAQAVHGFVEELVVNDDPEYQWIDKIRPPRVSNEARQTLFFKLSGELQRKVGVKALDLGGNSVIGYSQAFDLEGDSGIVARGIGTAVTLIKMPDTPAQTVIDVNREELSPILSNPLSPKSSPELQIDPSAKKFTHHLSHTDLPSPAIQHSTSLHTLLKQEEMRGTPRSGLSQRLKNFRYSSQSLISKKINALRSKFSDSGNIVPTDTLQQKRKKFKRTKSESSTMAQVLVSSVMTSHNSLNLAAHNSLDCIMETHDSAPVLQKQMSLNESYSNDDELLDKSAVSFLSLPDTSIHTNSSNMSDSSDSTSSDGEVSDTHDDPLDCDTVSAIVKNVRRLSMLNRSDIPTNMSFQSIDTLEEQAEVDSSDEMDHFYIKGNNESIDDKKLDEYSLSGVGLVESEMEEVQAEMDETVDVGKLNEYSLNGAGLVESEIVKVRTEDDIAEAINEFNTEQNEKQLRSNHQIVAKENKIVFLLGDECDEKLAPLERNESEEKLPPLAKFESEERLPPLAQMDDFSVCSSEEESNLNILKESSKSLESTMDTHKDVSVQTTDPNVRNRSTSLDELSVPTYERFERKLIIPPVMMGARIENQSLIKTAMQTILLDKVNIMGTYTPPTSPSAATKAHTFNIPAKYTPASPEKDQSFFPQITKTFEAIHRSSTSTSLSDYGSDTGILGVKCTSLDNGLSRADSNRRSVSSLPEKNRRGREDKNNMPSQPNTRRVSVANSPSEKGFKDNLTSLDDIDVVNVKHHGLLSKAETKLKSVFVAPFSLYHNVHDSCKKRAEEEYSEHDGVKNQGGLLGTALGNVLMESVNDILATTQGKAEKEIEKADSIPPEVSQVNSNMSKADSDTSSKCQPFREVRKENFFSKSSDPSDIRQIINETDTDGKEVSSQNKEESTSSPNEVPTDLTQTPHPHIQSVLITNSVAPTNKNAAPTMPANLEIEKGNNANQTHASLQRSLRNNGSPVLNYSRPECGHQRTESMGAKLLHSPAKLNAIPCIHRRSSDSDLSITPKGNSLTGSDRSSGAVGGHFMRNNNLLRSIIPQDNFDIMEYPFLTMSKYPPGFIAYLGGVVSARSVKLLERITNIEEPESRDTWWSEIRMEIRSHARAYNCNSVLGYSETTSICDDVCVLSASGTAAIIGFQYSGEGNDNLGALPIIPKTYLAGKDVMSSSLDRSDFERERKSEFVSINQNNGRLSESPERESATTSKTTSLGTAQSCVICHLPYNGSSASLRSKIYKCGVCRGGKVPEILIATVEIPERIPCIGRGCFLQSYVSRPVKDMKGESYAKEISDGLPFLEYELHRILVNKVKVKGMNAIFGLKIRISIGEKMLIGIATGTAVFLSALPSPPLPKLVCDRTTKASKLEELQRQLHETIKKNKETYQLKVDVDQNGKSDTDDSEDEQTVLDLAAGNKDCCILEVDDPDDVEILNLLMELRPPDGFHVVNTELVPGLEELEIVKNLQMFIQIWRAKIHPPNYLEKHFQRLLETVYFKLRRMVPCALCDLQFRVDSPEPDEIQLCVVGMALGLGDPQKNLKSKRKAGLSKRNDDEMIFNLEEDQIPENSVVQTPPNASSLQTQLPKHRPKSPQRVKSFSKQRHVPYIERHGVDITPLSYVPGGKIERYLGNLNFFFIRETTSVREEGGFSAFIHGFVTEVLAIIRAHVTALGGNAMVAYFMTECVLNQNIHKNQGQCLINVGGDVVYVSYFSEEQ